MRRALLALVLVSSCARDGAADPAAPPKAPAPKDAPMSEPKLPHYNPPAKGDTTRYAAWLQKKGVTTADKLRENMSLRIGDWSFFDHVGARPGSRPGDVVALDKAGHELQQSDKGDWWAFLSTAGLDAAGAQDRIAWLLGGVGIAPDPKLKDVKAPTLEVTAIAAKFIGYYGVPGPGMKAQRVTLTAAPAGSKLQFDAL